MTTVSRPADTGAPVAVPRHVRRMTTAWGSFMLAMAAVNGALAAAGRSQVYVEFVTEAYLDVYRRAWDALVAPHPLPWVLALVAFEAAIGWATLRSGRLRVIGLAGSAAFVVALTPAGPYTLGTPRWRRFRRIC